MQELGLVDYIGESVVVVGHHNADPDAIGSAHGIKELIEALKPDSVVEIVMPEDISSLSKKIIEELDLKVHEKSSKLFDTVIVVDSGGLNQLGKYEKTIKTHDKVTVFIDHHNLDDNISQYIDLLIHDKWVSSTCELVYRLYEEYKINPSSLASKALLAGIMFDTKYLSIGNSETLRTAAKLLENIGDISDIKSLMQMDTDMSERIARIKTAQRSELHRVHDWLIVLSDVRSYQASGARALVSLGADLAIVTGSDKGKLRASLRSTQKFYIKTGIHMGDLVTKISDGFNGTGSGHPTAAGFNGTGSSDDFKKELLRIISNEIV